MSCNPVAVGLLALLLISCKYEVGQTDSTIIKTATCACTTLPIMVNRFNTVIRNCLMYALCHNFTYRTGMFWLLVVLYQYKVYHNKVEN